MRSGDRAFLFPNSNYYIIIKSNALDHMYTRAQRKWFQRESGGQIFSRTISGNPIVIEHITGHHLTDLRSRHGWKPNRTQLIKDREKMFRDGLHVVGLWHTHPEPFPTPSTIDRKTCEAHTELLDISHKGFLMITVGNSGFPPNISVYFSDRSTQEWYSLLEHVR